MFTKDPHCHIVQGEKKIYVAIFNNFTTGQIKVGQRTENREQRTEDREQRTEDREQRTDNRGHRTENRGQRTEDR